MEPTGPMGPWVLIYVPKKTKRIQEFEDRQGAWRPEGTKEIQGQQQIHFVLDVQEQQDPQELNKTKDLMCCVRHRELCRLLS